VTGGRPRNRLEVVGHFDVPVRLGFDYITDPRHWPDYWPGVVRIHPGSRWCAPGDRATVDMRLAGRTTRLEMTLETFDPPRLVIYRSVQRGLPAARHEREFTPETDGFRFRLAVELERRVGLRSVLDLFVVKPAVARVLRRTVTNLERRFADLRAGTP
jgi:uncharacterized protein YndB with AHSA1/START domain